MRARAARRLVLSSAIVTAILAVQIHGGESAPNPVLFVAQFPIADDFATIGSTFANHLAAVNRVGRGGGLFVRYTDGTVRDLTAEAGYGESAEFQGVNSIAVREPQVHWDGTKAIFSMAIGAPPVQYQWTDETWQLYEVTGLGQGETAVVTPVPFQPTDSNNVSPATHQTAESCSSATVLSTALPISTTSGTNTNRPPAPPESGVSIPRPAISTFSITPPPALSHPRSTAPVA